jgi:hypothetical protein
MELPESSEKQEELTKAGLLNRIIAKTIDFIIVGALFEIIPKIGYLAGVIYLLIADGLFDGRSIGKKLIGLRVILYTHGNSVCGFKESIIRNFPFVGGYILFGILKGIPLIGWILSIIVPVAILLFESLIMVGSEDGMRMGDEFAKTRVVEEKAKTH